MEKLAAEAAARPAAPDTPLVIEKPVMNDEARTSGVPRLILATDRKGGACLATKQDPVIR